MNIEELINSFNFDEFGAVGAVVNWLNEAEPNYHSNLEERLRQLNSIILKHAEENIDVNEA